MTNATAKAIPAGKGKESIIVTYADGTTEEVRKAVPVGKYNAVSIVYYRSTSIYYKTQEMVINEWTGGFPSRDIQVAAKNKGGMKATSFWGDRKLAEQSAEMLGKTVQPQRKRGVTSYAVANDLTHYPISIERA